MAEKFLMVAKTLHGLEEVLSAELLKLGAQKIVPVRRAVRFVGDKGFMYKANLGLRTALTILKPIKSFKTNDESDLYNNVYEIDWEKCFGPENSFKVSSTVHSEQFKHSKYVALKVKDAIADKFKDAVGSRPDIDTDNPDFIIHVRIDRNECTISLDSSGESLYKRGYRQSTNIAPINEVLAAGLLLLSGWDGQCDFMDPMCGSGTILIEAALIACNIPPNIMRKEYAFMKWKDWDETLFEKIEDSLFNKTKDFDYRIVGYDKAPSAVQKAIDNVIHAKLDEYVSISQKDFFKTKKQSENKLHMLFNPPYGERLQLNEERFYEAIGDTLKRGYQNTDAWFITSNLDALKFVGLRPSRKIKVYNAALEARLLKYEIYEGSRKAKKQTTN